jgi:predicted acetyltransferase
MEYRPLPDDDAGTELFVRYVQYAFQPTSGPDPTDVLEDDDRPDPPRVKRGLYPEGAAEDADPVSILSSYDFATQLRGATLSMGGVSTVATPPEHRRQGYVATLLRELAREYRETDTPIAALWPFEHPFYRKYGWATCNRYCSWTAAPSDLREAASAPAGAWRRLDRDEWEPLDAVHDAAMAGHDLAVDRTERWWTERVLRSWRTDPFVYLWEDDAGEPRAYLLYRIEGDWGDRTLHVDEHGATDPEAFGQVLRFLTDHDSQVKEVTFSTAPDASLLDRVRDPREVDCEVEAGPMFRLVDVESTLTALAYPADGRVTVGLSDPLLPELEGTYELTVADGRASCERTDVPADAETDVGAFSQLVCGYRSAETLATAGDLDADAETLATLDALFPESAPYLKEGF